jgi:histidinol phosphatase-like enzyme (inositol monophosphatase family)
VSGRTTPVPVPDPELIAFAHDLADRAGAVIRPLFRQPLDVDTKSDESPVTVADRGAEAAIRELINDRYPEHGILGEEFGAERADSDWVWHLDPIDGTKSFISGSAQFATLIALAWRGEPVIGIIDQPIQRERWVGVTGRETLFNGKPVRTRDCGGIDRATFFSWGAECFEGDRGAALWRLAQGTALRRYSADAYAYGLLALGFVDIVAENDLKPHDYLALAPVVNGAGGRITDWEGNEIRFGTGAETVAVGDPALHAQVIALLKG